LCYLAKQGQLAWCVICKMTTIVGISLNGIAVLAHQSSCLAMKERKLLSLASVIFCFIRLEVEIIYDLLSSLSLEEGERDTRAINFCCV
jgi:hypothetical protein